MPFLKCYMFDPNALVVNYVGETKQKVCTRMNSHEKIIKDRDAQMSVEGHFS